MAPLTKFATAALTAICLAGPLPAPASAPRGTARNILIITMDTTRADHLGCYGYAKAKTPSVDALARRGVRFANAYSHVPLTLPSHCSIMTGTDPLFHQVRNNGLDALSTDIPTLAAVLKANGFRTAAFVASFTLDSRFGIGRGFDLYDDRFQEDEILKNFRSERKADQVFAAFSAWLDGQGPEPFFAWVHFYDPHLPYNPPSPFREEFADRKYDGEIAFTDFTIGRILDKLRAKQALDSTLILITGDHGEALGERKEIDHGLFVYDNTLRVPLILSSPGEIPGGAVVTARVRLMDIMPTLLDLRKISIPGSVQGTSLLPFIAGRKKDDLPVYFETYYPRDNFGWSELRGLIDGAWKLILAPRPELYNLKEDPAETADLFQARAAVSREKIGKLEKLVREHSGKPAAVRRTLTLEEEQRLRALGYIGSSGTDGARPAGLADPKDKIGDYLLYFQGNVLETEGQFEKAAACYKEVLRLNPDVPANYANLGFLYMKMNRTGQAIEVLEQAQGKFPTSVTILSRLMTFYLRAERLDKAISTGQSILSLVPRHFEALFLSGSAYATQGKWGEALRFYRQAIEIEPENKTLRHREAFALAALGRYPEALEAYGKLKAQYPSDAALDIEMSRIYEGLGQREKALGILKAAAERNPSPEAQYAFALALEKSGDLPEAVRRLQRYLETTTEGQTPRKAMAVDDLARWKARLGK
jgi:arylsulfatase A-like enzyme/Tfp pilus assembly protein PilF